jgi:hypothetical protein
VDAAMEVLRAHDFAAVHIEAPTSARTTATFRASSRPSSGWIRAWWPHSPRSWTRRGTITASLF